MAGVCWGIDNCVTAGLDQVGPATITLVKGVVAGSANVAIGLALGHSLPGGWDSAGALVIGMLGYGASITLWVRGAQDLGAARGQLVFSSAPFVGAAVSWVVLAMPSEVRRSSPCSWWRAASVSSSGPTTSTIITTTPWTTTTPTVTTTGTTITPIRGSPWTLSMRTRTITASWCTPIRMCPISTTVTSTERRDRRRPTVR